MTGAEQRELGVLATKMANLEQKFEEHRQETREHRNNMNRQFENLEGSVQLILDKINGWRGGWKAMTVVGAITSTITAIVFQTMQILHK